MKTINAMSTMRLHAINDGRTPRRWEINQAALNELMRETGIIDPDIAATKTIFGIPYMLVISTSDEPVAKLIVDTP